MYKKSTVGYNLHCLSHNHLSNIRLKPSVKQVFLRLRDRDLKISLYVCACDVAILLRRFTWILEETGRVFKKKLLYPQIVRVCVKSIEAIEVLSYLPALTIAGNHETAV